MEWILSVIPDRPFATLTSDDPPFILQVFIFCKIIKIVVLPLVFHSFAETIRFSIHCQVGFFGDCVRPLRSPENVGFAKGFISVGQWARIFKQGVTLGMIPTCQRRIVGIVVFPMVLQGFAETVKFYLFLTGSLCTRSCRNALFCNAFQRFLCIPAMLFLFLTSHCNQAVKPKLFWCYMIRYIWYIIYIIYIIYILYHIH